MKKALAVKRTDAAQVITALSATLCGASSTTGDTESQLHFMDTNLREKISFVSPITEEFFKLPVSLGLRDDIETDPSFLQLIPYIVLVDAETEELFTYTRGKKGTENRLHDKVALGLGGHVETEPGDELPLETLLAQDALRELEEEVGIKPVFSDLTLMRHLMHSAGMVLYTEAAAVDCVHLGIAVLFPIDRKRLGTAEHRVIENGKWMTLEALLDDVTNGKINAENWTRLLADNSMIKEVV